MIICNVIVHPSSITDDIGDDNVEETKVDHPVNVQAAKAAIIILIYTGTARARWIILVSCELRLSFRVTA